MYSDIIRYNLAHWVLLHVLTPVLRVAQSQDQHEEVREEIAVCECWTIRQVELEFAVIYDLVDQFELVVALGRQKNEEKVIPKDGKWLALQVYLTQLFIGLFLLGR